MSKNSASGPSPFSKGPAQQAAAARSDSPARPNNENGHNYGPHQASCYIEVTPRHPKVYEKSRNSGGSQKRKK